MLVAEAASPLMCSHPCNAGYFFFFFLHGEVDPCSGGNPVTLSILMRPDLISWKTGRESQEAEWSPCCTTSWKEGALHPCGASLSLVDPDLRGKKTDLDPILNRH